MQLQFFRIKPTAKGLLVPNDKGGQTTKFGATAVDLLLSVDLPYIPAMGTQVTITEANKNSNIPGERVDHNFTIVHHKLTLAPAEGQASVAVFLLPM